MFGKLFGKGPPVGEVPEIGDVLLTREAVDDADPNSAVGMNINILNVLLHQCGYAVPDVPRESVESYAVDFYHSQVLNGGHEQFAANAQGNPYSWSHARSGLAAMGATEHLALFDRFKTIIDRDDARAKALIASGGFGPTYPEVEEIEEAFYAADERNPLATLNAAWLKALPNLDVRPQQEMENHLRDIADHPAVKARMKRR